MKKVFSSTPAWGPALPKHRTGRYADYTPTTVPPEYTPPLYQPSATFTPMSGDKDKGVVNEGFADATTYMWFRPMTSHSSTLPAPPGDTRRVYHPW